LEDIKEILKLLIEFLLRYGLVGVLIVVLLLIIHEPERATKLKAIFFEPLFRLTKWGSKQYIGSKVSSQVTEFLRSAVIGKLSNKGPFRVKVRWVTSPSDPVLKKDGTVILRMRETADQTRNVLAATQLVLPYTSFTLLRPALDSSVRAAVDLAILNKMAIKLGTHARVIFQRHFLTPETDADQRVADLFKQLVELDSGGLFVSIFLEELEILADVVYVEADFVDRSKEVCALLTYLLTIVRREVGEEVDLTYHSATFHIGIIMVGKSAVAEAMGVGPYIRRLQKDINEGCDTVYLLAFSHKESFLPRVLRAIEQEDRVIIDKESVVSIKEDGETVDRAMVVRVHRNDVFTDQIFQERLQLAGVKVGDTIEGVVTDVSQEQALITAKGLKGRICRTNASWNTVTNCGDVLEVGGKRDFRVTAIRKDVGELELSLRFPSNDPWTTSVIPDVGDICEVHVIRDCGSNYLCRLDSEIELSLPKAEVSWLADEVNTDLLRNARKRVLITHVNSDQRLIKCSIRRLENDPWPQIALRFPKGTCLQGTVIKTTPHFVHVDLGDGIVGGIPRSSMVAAGFEFAAFQKNVVPGQGLDVVVAEVLPVKQIIRLDLQRNLASRPQSTKSRRKRT
jgi:hypothetical protein